MIDPVFNMVKNFFVTRWSCFTTIFKSVLECRQAIVNVFTNKMTNQDNRAQPLDIADKKSKAYRAQELAFDREFCSLISFNNPIIEVFSHSLTFLKYDICPLSLVPISFGELQTLATKALPADQATYV